VDTNMSGKLVVVTGATGGIGKEIARGVVRLGGNVVVAARDPSRCEATRKELAAEKGGGEITSLPVDMAEQASVRAFAAAFAERHPALDVLVNNAGAWFTGRRESPDGYELTFATNVLGPHLLTELLLDRMGAAPRARVVNLISTISGSYDPTDLQYSRRPYDGYKAYGQSKQALTMLTIGLARRMADSGVTANAVEPGFVRTGFNANATGPQAVMIKFFARLMGVSPAKGADGPLWVATSPELDGVTGKRFAGRKEKPMLFGDSEPIAELERICA
jgi:NAD(P)-dependent dehydrogenase (short-subunit alcohol dehydrogenase family)